MKRQIGKIVFTWLPLCALFFGCITLTGCPDDVPSTSTDCGFSAMIETPKGRKQAEVIFSQVLAEVLNGHTNCGFGFRPTRVQKASAGGSALPEQGGKSSYVYLLPKGFDPARDKLTIEYNGRSYGSDISTARRIDEKQFVALR